MPGQRWRKLPETRSFILIWTSVSTPPPMRGTQALIAGELAFDALAKELSRLSQNPVMLLYLCDGDFWGYDFYGGKEEDHFSTMPDYFDSISQAEKERLAGNPAVPGGVVSHLGSGAPVPVSAPLDGS